MAAMARPERRGFEETQVITIYHLDRSRSERAVWLMEELGEPYEIEHFDRLETLSAEPAYKKLHPLGSSPVIRAEGKILAESGAVVEYLATMMGGGRLAVKPGDPNYIDYLYWFHFAESTLMPQLVSEIMSEAGGVPHDNPGRQYARGRVAQLLSFVDGHLAKVDYLAGAFSAADIMVTFAFTTTTLFVPVDLAPYPHIRAYLDRIGSRPGFQRAQRIAGPNRVRD